MTYFFRDWPFDCFTRMESGTCVCLRSETLLFLQLLLFSKEQPNLSSRSPVDCTRQPENDWLGAEFVSHVLAGREKCVCVCGGVVGEAVCTGESLSQAREGLPCTGRLPPLPCLPTPDRIPPRSRCNNSMPRWLMLHGGAHLCEEGTGNLHTCASV